MPARTRAVKQVVRVVTLRVGRRQVCLKVTEKLEEMLNELVEKGYFADTSEAIRCAIVLLYLTIKEMEGKEGKGG
jgi:Arc/MetJ-type ribon-helix-helix transcriptional regulator